ncbi:MAG: ABC transporter permease [Bacillota bacterium]|nr:ABC transporter permease [Bacillota bacterium]
MPEPGEGVRLRLRARLPAQVPPGVPARVRATALTYLVVLVFLLGGWWVFSAGLALPALPGPMAALHALARTWGEGLSYHTAVSAGRVVASLVLAAATAVPLGLALGQVRAADRVAGPAIYLTYPVPKSVFLPVVMAVLGLGDAARIFMVWLVVFFQVLVGTRDASRSISPQFLHSMRSLGASPLAVYRHVVWPAVLPAVFTSLRVGLGTAIAVLFLAETWASQSGIGYFIMLAWTRLGWEDVFAGVLAMAALGMGLYLILDLLERVTCPWRFA